MAIAERLIFVLSCVPQLSGLRLPSRISLRRRSPLLGAGRRRCSWCCVITGSAAYSRGPADVGLQRPGAIQINSAARRSSYEKARQRCRAISGALRDAPALSVLICAPRNGPTHSICAERSRRRRLCKRRRGTFSAPPGYLCYAPKASRPLCA